MADEKLTQERIAELQLKYELFNVVEVFKDAATADRRLYAAAALSTFNREQLDSVVHLAEGVAAMAREEMRRRLALGETPDIQTTIDEVFGK